MSVAFRRESDDEHKEPRFELPIPPGPNLVTARGLALIEARVATLEARVGEVGEVGEAAVLEEAKRDLRYWRQRLATARVTAAPGDGEIGFGSRVTFSLNGTRRTIGIVGEDEADPAAGLLGISAPLAQALVGAGEGDVVAFAGKADAIEVVEVGV